MQILEFFNSLREMLYQGTGVPVYSEATYEAQDAAVPCIVFSRDGTSGEQTMTAPSLLTEIVTFSAKAPTIEEVERLREYIISSLNGYNNEIQIALSGESDEYDNFLKIYTRDISFSIMYGSTGAVTTGSFGSSTITSASYAETASYALNYNPTATASYALSAGQVDTASFAITASFLLGNVDSASYAVTAAYAANATAPAWEDVTNKPSVFSSSAQVDYTDIQNKPTTIDSASYATTTDFAATSSYTVNLVGTASNAYVAVSASHAATASYFDGAVVSASYAVTAGFALVSAGTASNAQTAVSASYALTASYVSGQSETASYAIYSENSTSASYASTVTPQTWDSITSKPSVFSSSAQVDFNNIQNQPTTIATASYVENAQTASYFSGAVATASYAVTAAFALVSSGTASSAATAVSASYSDYALTASYALNGGGGGTASLPPNVVSSSAQLEVSGGVAFTTSSNVIFGDVQVNTMNVAGTNTFGDSVLDKHEFTGSVEITGSLKLDHATIMQGTSSFAVTASYLNGSVVSASYAESASKVEFLSISTTNSNVVLGSGSAGMLGSNNTTVGKNAGTLLTTGGNSNTFIGSNVGARVTTGDFNTAIGTAAMTASNTTGNTAVGFTSLRNVSGIENTAIGRNSGLGGQNVEPYSQSVTTGTNNTFLGAYTGVESGSGAVSNSTVIGYGVLSKGTNTTVIGNSNTTHTYLLGNVTASVFTGTFTGSLQGSSSYALTASYALNGGGGGTASLPPNVVSSSQQLENGGGVAFTSASNVTFGEITASSAFVSGTNTFGDSILDKHEFTGSVEITGSFKLNHATTMHGTASYAVTASYVTGQSATASYAITASYALNGGGTSGISSSLQLENGGGQAFTSASNVTFGEITASSAFISGTNTFGDSIADKHEFTGSVEISGSLKLDPATIMQGTSSFAVTASYVLGQAATASWAEQALTASYYAGSVVSSSFADKSILADTASHYAGSVVSASFADKSILSDTASYALNALGAGTISSSQQLENGGGYAFTTSSKVTFGEVTGSRANLGTITASYMYAAGVNRFGDSSTDWHHFYGDVGVTGSLNVSGGVIVGDTQLAVDINRHGFLNTTETSQSFSGTTLTLHDLGSGWSYYRTGIKYTISGSKTVALSSSTKGLYYIYIDSGDGALVCSIVNTPWTLLDSKVPVATIDYDSALTPTFWLADERHTALMDQRMQYYIHATIGAAMITPPTIGGYGINVDANISKSLSISAAKIVDQDLQFDLAALSQTTPGTTADYTIFYRASASLWNWTSSIMPFPYNIGNTNNWIQWDNNGTLTDATGGGGGSTRWVNSYLLLNNKNGKARHAIIPGRAIHSSLAAAQSEDVSAWTWAGLDIDEGVICYRFTWTTVTSTSAGKCRLAEAPAAINISPTTNVSSGASIDHNTLANLQGGTTGQYYHLSSASYAAVTSGTASYVKGSSVDVIANSKDGTLAGDLLFSDHFLNTTAGETVFTYTTVGAGASSATMTAEAGHPGIVMMQTGTTSTGSMAQYKYTQGIVFGLGTYDYEAMVRLPTASISTDRYTYRAGFNDTQQSTDTNDGAHFEYTDAASPNWVLKTSINGVRTVVTSSIAVNVNTWTKLRVKVQDTSTASFYVDGTYAGEITTNIPSGSGAALNVMQKISKFVGTAAATCHVDYVRLRYY